MGGRSSATAEGSSPPLAKRMLGQEMLLPFSAPATFPAVQELQDKRREHVSLSVSPGRI